MSNDNLWFQRTETPEPEPTEPTRPAPGTIPLPPPESGEWTVDRYARRDPDWPRIDHARYRWVKEEQAWVFDPTRPASSKWKFYWMHFDKDHPWLDILLMIPMFFIMYPSIVKEDILHGLPQGTSNPTLHRP